MEAEEIIEKVFKNLESVFSTIEFNRNLRSKNYPVSLINNGSGIKFLKRNASKISDKMWQKKANDNGQLDILPYVTQTPKTPLLNEKMCIDFLKNNGYKISKTVEF